MLNFRAAYARRTNLNVEAARRSETLVLLYKYSRHNIPDDGNDRQHRCENLRSRTRKTFFICTNLSSFVRKNGCVFWGGGETFIVVWLSK